jgi:hypothetical protein
MLITAVGDPIITNSSSLHQLRCIAAGTTKEHGAKRWAGGHQLLQALCGYQRTRLHLEVTQPAQSLETL